MGRPATWDATHAGSSTAPGPREWATAAGMSEVELERELAAGRRAREQIVRAVERGDAMRSSALV